MEFAVHLRPLVVYMCGYHHPTFFVPSGSLFTLDQTHMKQRSVHHIDSYYFLRKKAHLCGRRQGHAHALVRFNVNVPFERIAANHAASCNLVNHGTTLCYSNWPHDNTLAPPAYCRVASPITISRRYSLGCKNSKGN